MAGAAAAGSAAGVRCRDERDQDLCLAYRPPIISQPGMGPRQPPAAEPPGRHGLTHIRLGAPVAFALALRLKVPLPVPLALSGTVLPANALRGYHPDPRLGFLRLSRLFA
jgi:hypothetical protein